MKIKELKISPVPENKKFSKIIRIEKLNPKVFLTNLITF